MSGITDLYTFGCRVSEIRERKLLTQRDLAHLMRKEILDIQLLEIGVKDFNLGDFFIMLEILDISFQEFFNTTY